MHKTPGRSLRHPAVFGGLLFLALALWNLPRPGPYYDEAIDVVDSITFSGRAGPYGLRTWFHGAVTVGGVRIPLTRAVYTGPVKTWLFTAVFAVLGPGVLPLRLGTVSLGLVALLLTAVFARRLFSVRTAFWTVLFLGTDPSFLFLSRTDNGPSAVMMVVKAAALASLLKWWNSGRRLWLGLGGVFLGLGLSDKANFIHFILALALTALIVSRGSSRGRLWRALPGGLFYLALGSVPFLLYHLFYPRELYDLWIGSAPGAREYWGITWSVSENATRVGRLLRDTLNGSFVQAWILGRAAPLTGWFPWFLLASLAGTGLLRLQGLLPAGYGKKMGFLLLLFLLILAGLFFTPQARNAWHFLTLYPLPHLLAAAGLDAWLAATPARGAPAERLRRGAVFLCAIAVVAVNLGAVVLSHREIAADRVGREWSADIYDLAEVLRSHPRRTAVCMDWGLYNGLALLLRGETPLEDFFDIHLRPKRYRILGEKFRDRSSLFVFYAAPEDSRSPGRKLFQKVLETFGCESRPWDAVSPPGRIGAYEALTVRPVAAR